MDADGSPLPIAQTKIDNETQWYCFYLSMAFFIDFVSVWFDQYSKYFAGLRLDEVSYLWELTVQRAADFKAVSFAILALSEYFLLGQYMR